MVLGEFWWEDREKSEILGNFHSAGLEKKDRLLWETFIFYFVGFPLFWLLDFSSFLFKLFSCCQESDPVKEVFFFSKMKSV